MDDYRAFVLSRTGPSAASAAVMPDPPPNSCNVVSSSMSPKPVSVVSPVSSSADPPSWRFHGKKKSGHV
jgi:hypothetical protein